MSLYEHFSEKELETLRARAERAANIAQQGITGEILTTALHIILGSETYALPVELLRAVYENVPVVSVPCTPPFVAGIANIRGRIMPVLDLAVLLNAPRPKSDTSPSLAVISRDVLTLAFRVERVGEIMTFPASSVGSLPTGNNTLDRAYYLQGILADGTTVLNMNAILDDPTIVVEDSIL